MEAIVRFFVNHCLILIVAPDISILLSIFFSNFTSWWWIKTSWITAVWHTKKMLDINWNKIKTLLKNYLPAVLLVAFGLFILILIVLLCTQICRKFTKIPHLLTKCYYIILYNIALKIGDIINMQHMYRKRNDLSLRINA